MAKSTSPKRVTRTRNVRSKPADSLEQRVEQLEWYTRFASANPFDNVFMNGVEIIKEQLAPLRDLTPTRTQMTTEQLNQLKAIRADLARPDWSAPADVRIGSGQSTQPGRTAR